MTAAQIAKALEPYPDTEIFWLQQIAYQLAVANERNAKQDGELAELALKEREYQFNPQNTTCMNCGKRFVDHYPNGACPK
jgi:hypothetical protein